MLYAFLLEELILGCDDDIISFVLELNRVNANEQDIQLMYYEK